MRKLKLTISVVFFCLPGFVITGSAVSADNKQKLNDYRCSAILPDDASAVDDIKLCHSDRIGKNEVYACQDFVTGNARYRVLFKGGRHPKAIVRIHDQEDVMNIIRLDKNPDNPPLCQLSKPEQIPALARFMGAGVCSDDSDQSVACAVFRHKAPRLKTVSDYMVYYRADGSGPKSTASFEIGANQDAMPAELAYQIGINLLQTRCCQQRGLRYLELAYQMFPDYTLYRTAYLDANKQGFNKPQAQVSASQQD